MSIPNIANKIKYGSREGKGKDIVLALIILLSCGLSFMLGYMSAKDDSARPVAIRFDPSLQVNAGLDEGRETSEIDENKAAIQAKDDNADGSVASDNAIVASKRGSKYYFTWCSGAKNLSEENKIYFKTEKEAQAAGYSISTSCE